jgi:hypothetical protein
MYFSFLFTQIANIKFVLIILSKIKLLIKMCFTIIKILNLAPVALWLYHEQASIIVKGTA